MTERRCSIDGCERPLRTRGWCNAHYERWRNLGDPLASARPTPTERFWPKVEVGGPDDCWLWTSTRDTGGYGRFSVEGQGVAAHRYAYEQIVGPVPDGLHLDHLCRNRACVNPAHLDPVTCKENVMRGEGLAAQNAAKTHCPQGHPYDDENTYVLPSRPTARYCRACSRERALRRYYEMRAAA